MRRSSSRGIALDLGSATFRIGTRDRVVVEERAVVAFDDHGRSVAVGDEATALHTSRHHRLVQPVERATLSDVDALREALDMLFDMVPDRGRERPPTMLAVSLCAPLTARTEFMACVRDAWVGGGVDIVESPVAAAVGAGVDGRDSEPVLVVDIGRGATEAAVVSASQIVAAASEPVGGHDVDVALDAYLRQRHGLGVALADIEAAKIALSDDPSAPADVVGRDVVTGLSRSRSVSAAEVAFATEAVVDEIAAVASRAFADTPPQLRRQLESRSVVLTGAASALVGLAHRLQEATGLDCGSRLPRGPRAVINGTRALLAN